MQRPSAPWKLICVIALVGVAACGGGKKPPEGPSDEAEVDDRGGSDPMVTPERMDEITSFLKRKNTVMVRCLTDAIDKGEADKNSRGYVTLGFTITAAGRAEKIKVLEASLQSQSVHECMVAHVATIEFGALPKAIDWSHRYQVESY